MCDCIGRVNKILEPRGEQLKTVFALDDKMELSFHIMVPIEHIESKSRAKLTALNPNNCMFCGEVFRVENKEDGAEQKAKEQTK